MRLWIEKKPLLVILSHCSGFAKKNVHEAGHPLVLKADPLRGMLQISSGDSDLFLIEELPCDVQEAGSITVPFHLFFDIARKMTTPIGLSFSHVENVFCISSQESEFSLPVLHSVPTSLKPSDTLQASLVIGGPLMKKGLESVRISLSTEEGRPHLNGFLMHQNKSGEFTFVATDTHRLSVFSFASSEDFPMRWPSETLVSRKALLEWLKLLQTCETAAIGYGEKCLLFKTETAHLYSRVLEGVFPHYEKALQKDKHFQAVLDKKRFIQALDRASLMVQQEKNPMIVCSFEAHALKIVGKSRFGNASESLQGEAYSYQGPSTVLHLNPRYTLEALQTFQEERVSLFFGEGMIPLILEAYYDSSEMHKKRPYRLVHVMMPMRR